MGQIMLTAFTIAVSVGVLNIHHRNSQSRPSRWTTVFCYQVLGCIVCIKQDSSKTCNAEIQDKTDLIIEGEASAHTTKANIGVQSVILGETVVQQMSQGHRMP